MFDFNGFLIQAHNWIVAQATTLRVISYLLGGFSLIFGGKVLGRFLNLTDKGGFYSSVLFAVPTAACFAALTFAEDVITNRTLSRLYTSAFHYRFDTTSLTVFTGLVTLVFAITNPNAYRSEEERRPYSALELIMYCISMIASTFASLYFISYYLFVVLKWFGASPPQWWVLAIYALIFGSSLTWIVARQASGQNDNPPVIGCLAAAILGVPLYASLFVLLGSLILRFGWVMVIFMVVAMILGSLIAILRYIADHVERSTVLRIFAIPGAIALILQFAVNNTNLLPH